MPEKKRLLTVLSDKQLCDLIQNKILSPVYFEIEHAGTIEHAWTCISTAIPDLIVVGSDDGEESLVFAHEVLKRYPIMPLIFVDRQGIENCMQKSLRSGVLDCLPLPLKTDDFLKAIRRGLEHRRQLLQWLRLNADSLQNRIDILETLSKVGRSVTASLELDQVLTTIVNAAVDITNAEEGSLLILDEESGELYVRAARYYDDAVVRTFRLPIADSLANEVLRTGQPVVIDEATPLKIKTNYLVRTLMYVPLKVHGRVIGVLGVDNRTNGQVFSDRHGLLLTALADHAAIAIENARLFTSTNIERQKLETILTGIGDGVIVVDSEKRVLLANHAARAAFGVAQDDISLQPIERVFPHEQLLEMLTEAHPLLPYRCELNLDDGRTLNAQLTQIPGVGLAVTMQDITHLKELDRIKTDFVNTVSHDLRSPLTAILGYVELIERVDPVSERQREFIHRVQISVRNITNLINDLLELGRIESGFDTRKEFVPLSVIVQYSVDSLESTIIEKEHKLTLDFSDQNAKIFGDPTRLRQLVDNLIGNAIRYTPKSGQIKIRLMAETDQIILQIEDTGPGIPPADQPYIFDKFYRASNIPPDVPGSGLGLAIVKSIVENHQGRVWVDSSLGQGTVFTVVFPLADDSL